MVRAVKLTGPEPNGQKRPLSKVGRLEAGHEWATDGPQTMATKTPDHCTTSSAKPIFVANVGNWNSLDCCMGH